MPIVFIAVPNEKGKFEFNGTGFICTIPFDSTGVWAYLVTAKHVVINENTDKPFDNIVVRINSLNDSSYSIPFKIVANGLQKNIFFNPDTSVDLVVFGIALDINVLKWASIGDNLMFKSKKDFDTSYVKEGTNIFYTGMFSPYLGYKKNVPIIRFGKMSLITDEKLLWDSAKNELSNLFLVETTTFGGNSGSPVFSYDLPYRFIDTLNHHDPLKDSVKFIGIIKGSYLENVPIGFKQTSNMIPTYTSNVGISGVIPSYFLYEILYGSELKKVRQGYKKEFNTNKKK